MTIQGKCARCGHAEHAGACGAKGPSGCVPFFDGEGTGMICGARPPCPCAWRACACGRPLALACELPTGPRAIPAEGEIVIVSVERGSAGDPGGRLAVRGLDDGHLACRDLPAGEQPGQGEWRGREHTGECGKLARSEANPRWLTLG